MYIAIVHVNILSTKDQSFLWHYADDVSLDLLAFRESRSYQQKDTMAVLHKISKKRVIKRACKSKQHHKVIPHDVIDTIQD
jgi:hypothetical protein